MGLYILDLLQLLKDSLLCVKSILQESLELALEYSVKSKMLFQLVLARIVKSQGLRCIALAAETSMFQRKSQLMSMDHILEHRSHTCF